MILSNFVIVFVSLTFVPDNCCSFCVDLDSIIPAASRSKLDTSERLLLQLRVGSCATKVHGLTSGVSAPTSLARDFKDVEAVVAFGDANCRFLLLTRALQSLVYNPSTNTFKDGPRFVASRTNHAALAVSGGIVVACGGNSAAVEKTCEVYLPSNNEFKTLDPQMNTGRSDHTIHLFSSGNVCVIGGTASGGQEHRSIECLVVTGTASWTLLTTKLTHPRSQHSSAVSTGHLFVCGGKTTAAADTCEIFIFDDAGAMTKLQDIKLGFKVSMSSLFVSSDGAYILKNNGQLFKLSSTGSLITANFTGLTLDYPDTCVNTPKLVAEACSTNDITNSGTKDCTDMWKKLITPSKERPGAGDDDDGNKSSLLHNDKVLLWGIVLGCAVAGLTIELIKCHFQRQPDQKN